MKKLRTFGRVKKAGQKVTLKIGKFNKRFLIIMFIAAVTTHASCLGCLLSNWQKNVPSFGPIFRPSPL